MEVGKGLLGVLPHRVVQQHKGQGHRVGDAPAVGPRLTAGEEEDPAAIGHGLFGHRAVSGIGLRPQDKLRGPQDIALLGGVGDGAVFGLRGEPQHLQGLAGGV